MIEFLAYVVFLTFGAIFDAFIGLRFMRWQWSGASTSKREEVGFWVAVAMAFIYFSGRRYW